MNPDEIAELITRRRRQLLVHSIIYYELDDNVISDHQWAKWAKELEALQRDYPEIAKKCPRAREFEGFTEDTGINLKLKDPYALKAAYRVLAACGKTEYNKAFDKCLEENVDNAKKRLEKKDRRRRYEFDFKLHYLDCATVNYGKKDLYYYDVILHKPYRVDEFVKEAIRYRECFGFIGIDRECGTGIYPRCEYRFGNIVEPFPDVCQNLKVISADAVFGSDRIDYMLSVEEI